MGNTPQGPYGAPPSGQPGPMQDGDFTPAVRNASVHFATCEIDPPTALYIDVDDQFVLGAISDVNPGAVTCNLRILRPHGQIETVKIEVNLVTVNTLVTQTIGTREGYLLSAHIAPSAGFNANVLAYCFLAMQRGGSARAQQSRLLIAGYPKISTGLSWPDHQPVLAADGPGCTVAFAVGNPAAGADWAFTLSGQYRMQVNYVCATLTTSAAVATRTAALKISNGATTLAIVDSPTTQAASLANTYSGVFGGFSGGTGGTHLYWPLSTPTIIGGGYTIGTTTSNIQAADQWSAIVVGGIVWADIL